MSSLNSPTAVVHLRYDLSDLPAKPGPEWTRFVCLSDTHCRTFPVPPGDVLLHSGDLTHVGTLSEFDSALRWLQGLPHPHKIVIAGNHDISLHDHDSWYDDNYSRWHRGKENTKRVRQRMQDARQVGIVYLQEETYQFQVKPDGRTWSVYGFPWSPHHRNWAFNYQRGPEGDQLISTIPKTDILLTHAPPFDILDIGRGNEHAGCHALAGRVSMLQPQLHVFGHIHEHHGALIREWTQSASPSDARTAFVNAANMPSGPMSVTSNGKVPFGRGVYSPVIVDLYDSPDAVLDV
ncbi:hypothetical protein EUX98_g4664 [Antrodiella citrinella]|uniref:Calcineurin-like phosphoesterase domain-containing protein n=1 Tax=Antrodiella citrinella TaxID=2447956 RepID=A0A4V3XIK5_9APHY|nr:hypothetical protein EUX98_g4664 [Antrodiella citrinella]